MPIPQGAQWGYHPGGWGKPPVDEYNQPLYGDVFGISTVTHRKEVSLFNFDFQNVRLTIKMAKLANGKASMGRIRSSSGGI